MAVRYFSFSVRNSGSTPIPYARISGLAPVFVFFKKASDNSALTHPVISEVGNGVYKYPYDPDLNGDALGQVDAGATLSSSDLDRYIDVVAASDAIPFTDTFIRRDMGLARGGASAGRTIGQYLSPLRNLVEIVGNLMTVRREDDVTIDWQATVTADATAQPIIKVDPA